MSAAEKVRWCAADPGSDWEVILTLTAWCDSSGNVVAVLEAKVSLLIDSGSWWLFYKGQSEFQAKIVIYNQCCE